MLKYMEMKEMLNFKKDKNKNAERITQKEILQEVFRNFDEKIIKRKLLVDPDYMIEPEDIAECSAEYRQWLIEYFSFINVGIREYGVELDVISKENFEIFKKHFVNKKVELPNPITKIELLEKIREIVNNAPSLTDERVQEDDSSFGVGFMANLIKNTAGIFSVAHSMCLMYSKK